jgi:hypothetical protein
MNQGAQPRPDGVATCGRGHVRVAAARRHLLVGTTTSTEVTYTPGW